ncbi:monovalent cation/H(+) antiporter subunit G [Candidatus Puniceispirillum sp.]|uniref:monovalent cation/H(+) antiporter subunit G n=1 Tax=Candidatus Puniceispirillum sp. TaxID=2026719 RepID=UPI003F6A4D23
MLVSILSSLCLFIGIVALLIGSLGLLRLPDVYSRMHAFGMMDTAGVGFLILGMMLHAGFTLITVKLAFIGIFLFFTSPIAGHAVAQAAYKDGVKPLGTSKLSAKSPPSKQVVTKSAANKSAANKSAANKSAVNKSAAKKGVTKKSVAKKSVSKKGVAT